MEFAEIASKIAGEITLSEDAGLTIKKWREIFNISQKDLASALNINPSVISDYESGRRKSPGIKVVKKIVSTLINIDISRGSKILSKMSSALEGKRNEDIILDMKEFSTPIPIRKVLEILNCDIVSENNNLDNNIYGYTVIDSLKAIVQFTPLEIPKIYGSTTQRALVFTRVSTGRSPMVAIKITALKPSLVILHKPDLVDKLAVKIADMEDITLAVSKLENTEQIINNLKKI